jgi:hypothetical protein
MAYRDPQRQRAAEQKWYRENRQRVFDKKNQKKARMREMVHRAKERPCADCGITYPFFVMDFDHVDGDKVAIISKIASTGSVLQLLLELAKCEVVCANCHRARTWKRAAWIGDEKPRQRVRDGLQMSLFGEPGIDEPVEVMSIDDLETKRVRARLHVLEGLARAIEDWDRVERLVAGAPDRRAALVALTSVGFTDVQANYVLDMPLGWRTSRQETEVAAEIDALRRRLFDH